MDLFDFLDGVQLEEQLSRLQREKNDLQSRMEEDQEDLNELMKKHKAAVSQVGCSPCTLYNIVTWNLEPISQLIYPFL